MKLISFSLYGNNPRYCQGALENAKLLKKIYPDWNMKFFCGPEVNSSVIKLLSTYDNCEVEIVTKSILNPKNSVNSKVEGSFWRFLPFSQPQYECVISRDADSRINVREKAAVDAWLSSDYKAHAMRDHKNHEACNIQGMPLMAGMWGAKKGTIPDIVSLIRSSNIDKGYFSDQIFLSEYVYPLLSNSLLVHSSNSFPPHEEFKGFVGDAILDIKTIDYNAPKEYMKVQTKKLFSDYTNTVLESGESLSLEASLYIQEKILELSSIKPIKVLNAGCSFANVALTLVPNIDFESTADDAVLVEKTQAFIKNNSLPLYTSVFSDTLQGIGNYDFIVYKFGSRVRSIEFKNAYQALTNGGSMFIDE